MGGGRNFPLVIRPSVRPRQHACREETSGDCYGCSFVCICVVFIGGHLISLGKVGQVVVAALSLSCLFSHAPALLYLLPVCLWYIPNNPAVIYIYCCFFSKVDITSAVVLCVLYRFGAHSNSRDCWGRGGA